jgi:hypothetical protein
MSGQYFIDERPLRSTFSGDGFAQSAQNFPVYVDRDELSRLVARLSAVFARNSAWVTTPSRG